MKRIVVNATEPDLGRLRPRLTSCGRVALSRFPPTRCTDWRSTREEATAVERLFRVEGTRPTVAVPLIAASLEQALAGCEPWPRASAGRRRRSGRGR